MKKYINILLLISLIAACQDSRYDEMVNNSTYFPNSDLQHKEIYVIDNDDYQHKIWIYKAGYFSDALAGKLELDYNYLVEYNERQGTSYEMLDAKYYTFQRDFLIEEGEIETFVPILLKTTQLIEDFGYGKTHYLPIGIKSQTHKVEAYDEKAHVLLAFQVNQAVLKIDGENKGEVTHNFNNEDWKEFDFDLTTFLNIPAEKECAIAYTVDQSLVPEGQDILDAKYYTLSGSVTLPVGEQYAENYLTVDVESMPDGRWVIPVKITTDKPNIKVEDQTVLFTLIKGSIDVTWQSPALLGDKLVYGPNARDEKQVIGTYPAEQTAINVKTDAQWIHPVLENGEIKITVDAFAGPATDRTGSITVYRETGNLTEIIEVTQYASEELTPKSNWSIAAGNNKTTFYRNDVFENIIDGDINTQWQWNWGQSATSDFPNTPYEFDIDFGSEQILNTIALWQTQKSTNGYVKDVQFKISNNKSNWTDAGVHRMSESTDEAKAQGANPYVFTLPATYKARYVRLIILSNVGDKAVNHYKNAYMGEFSAYLK